MKMSNKNHKQTMENQLAETQKKGGVAVYIDTETALSTEFLSAIGVNTDSMLKISEQ